MKSVSKLYIASDHAGFALKEVLKNRLQSQPISVQDLGTKDGQKAVDYPDYADQLAEVLRADPQAFGVLICGSGQGMCMRANRYPHLRAALVWNEEVTRLARAHNDANVLCLGGRLLSAEEAWTYLQIFLQTPFEGGRHELRVKKLGQMKEHLN